MHFCALLADQHHEVFSLPLKRCCRGPFWLFVCNLQPAVGDCMGTRVHGKDGVTAYPGRLAMRFFCGHVMVGSVMGWREEMLDALKEPLHDMPIFAIAC